MRPSALTRRASTSSSRPRARARPAAREAPSADRTRPRRRPPPRPGRTTPERGLPPNSRSSAWASTVLPAPVSPVMTFRPGARRSSARSMRSRFSTRSSCSTPTGVPARADGPDRGAAAPGPSGDAFARVRWSADGEGRRGSGGGHHVEAVAREDGDAVRPGRERDAHRRRRVDAVARLMSGTLSGSAGHVSPDCHARS